jgi:hypothetical protein
MSDDDDDDDVDSDSGNLHESSKPSYELTCILLYMLDIYFSNS